MNGIAKIYEPLTTFLNTITVNVRSFGDSYLTTLEDESEFFEDNNMLCINNLYTSPFFIKLEDILNNIENSLKNQIDFDNPEKHLILECELIINQLIERLEIKEPNTVFLQIDITNSDLVKRFDAIISKLINKLKRHLKKLTILEAEIGGSDGLDSTLPPIAIGPNVPIRWNESINKLVDIFYQLSFELKNKEKNPLLETSTINLARFILNNFTDKEGNPLNANSVQTMLKPNQTLKRPQINKIVLRYTPM